MNAMEDRTLSRERKIGLFIFLLSEKQRHYNDIEMINRMLAKLRAELILTPMEVEEYKKEAMKYVEF